MSDSERRESVRRRYAEAARGMDPCCVPPVGPRGADGTGAEETGEAGEGDGGREARS